MECLIASSIAPSVSSPPWTCAIGIPTLAATSAAAIVELTSPYTTTTAGDASAKAFSRPTSKTAVWDAWEPEPTPKLMSGSGRPSSRKKTSDIPAS